MNQYTLLTHWHLAAPIERIWLALTRPGEWPGSWRIAESDQGTRAEYEWSVDTGKRWMNALAPLLAPAFRWNHGQVMREGARGLARHLGAALLEAS